MSASSSSPKPPYTKPWLSFEDQAQLLVARGMGGDVTAITKQLETTNYYRLSGYFYFFRKFQNENKYKGEEYREGTTFDEIVALYTFDSRLRQLVLTAIEKIEIAIRTKVSFHHAQKYGPFAYALDPASLPDIGLRMKGGKPVLKDGKPVSRRDEFLENLWKALDRSREQFIDHFRENYSDEVPPIWMASEILTLGDILYLYSGSPVDVRTRIALHFNVPHPVLGSWLLTLNTARNVCAHHGRFWNRAIGAPPQLPPEKRYPGWYRPVEIFPPFVKGTGIRPTCFVLLSICNHLLSEIAPGCGWAQQVKVLLDLYPRARRSSMGIPDNWTSSPVWHDVD